MTIYLFFFGQSFSQGGKSVGRWLDKQGERKTFYYTITSNDGNILGCDKRRKNSQRNFAKTGKKKAGKIDFRNERTCAVNKTFNSILL